MTNDAAPGLTPSAQMGQTVRRFVKLTVGYSLVTLLPPLLQIVLLPLYANILLPADYGVADVALTLSVLTSAVATFGVNHAVSVYFYQESNDKDFQLELIKASLVIVGTLAGTLTVGAAAFASPLSRLLFKGNAPGYLISLVAVNALANAILSVTTTAFRLQAAVKAVNITGVTSCLVAAASNLLFVVKLRLGATGIILAAAFTSAVPCLVSLYFLRAALTKKLNKAWVEQLGRTGAGLLPATISWLLLLSADRLLLTQYVSPHELGLYAVANKLTSVLGLLFTLMWSSWFPIALEMSRAPDAGRQYARMFEYFGALSTTLALFVGLFGAEILAVLTRQIYVPAAKYAAVLAIFVGPVTFMGAFFNLPFYVRKRTHFISIVNIAGAVANIVLNLALNPIWGVWGAVWATVLAGGVTAGLSFYFGRRLMPLPYRWRQALGMGVAYLCLLTVLILIPDLNSVPTKCGALALMILCATLCVRSGRPAVWLSQAADLLWTKLK